jgi:hypothetical protein
VTEIATPTAAWDRRSSDSMAAMPAASATITDAGSGSTTNEVRMLLPNRSVPIARPAIRRSPATSPTQVAVSGRRSTRS